MSDNKNVKKLNFERFSIKATRWIGSIESLFIHTFIFIGSFILYFCGIPLDTILLVLTTIVSLEAIYLAIFIQMSVNRQAKKLKDVARDVDEIQEDVEDIQEEEKEEKTEKKEEETLTRIEDTLGKLIEEVIELKKQYSERK